MSVSVSVSVSVCVCVCVCVCVSVCLGQSQAAPKLNSQISASADLNFLLSLLLLV